MNPLVEEMKKYFGSGQMSEEEFIAHYGTPHQGSIPHSGRYPWGSGDDPYQDEPNPFTFIDKVNRLKKNGWEETPENIEKEFNMTTKEYRMEKSIALDDIRMYNVARAKKLYASGHGYTDIR
jgi:hypothetical protein